MLTNIIYYVITLILGALFTYTVKVLRSMNDKFKNIELSNQNLLRSEIVRIYYQYKNEKRIPYYEKEVANQCADAYFKNNGNLFVEDIMEEINSWEVI